jgi:hypothetical protein
MGLVSRIRPISIPISYKEWKFFSALIQNNMDALETLSAPRAVGHSYWSALDLINEQLV